MAAPFTPIYARVVASCRVPIKSICPSAGERCEITRGQICHCHPNIPDGGECKYCYGTDAERRARAAAYVHVVFPAAPRRARPTQSTRPSPAGPFFLSVTSDTCGIFKILNRPLFRAWRVCFVRREVGENLSLASEHEAVLR